MFGGLMNEAPVVLTVMEKRKHRRGRQRVTRAMGWLTGRCLTTWFLAVFGFCSTGSVSTSLHWAGEGNHRLLIRVEPVAIGTRASDEMPAEAKIDLKGLCRQAGLQATVDVWMPNTGSRNNPLFPYSKMILDAEGLPVDAGVGLAPLVVDWDGDGLKDLLAGTHWSRIAFFKNLGTSERPSLSYQGLIQSDGGILELPFRPIVGRSEAPFKRDYYPVLEAVDWDDDGRLDLLAGGYVTGRIYFYRNSGRDNKGLPMLKFQDALEADGKPLNVGDWCAAPTVADFDSDGDLDLISGSYPMTPNDDLEDRRANDFLRYYENVGDRRRPVLRLRPFPGVGGFPSGGLASPRAADWNSDGLADLVVSSRSNIYLYENIGTASRPRLAVHDRPLPSNWGRADLPGTGAETPTQFLDWNHDGALDIVSGYRVWIDQGKGIPGVYAEPISLLPAAERIDHPSDMGDGWFWPRLYDLDQDGRRDVLFGDFAGRIWFHRNSSAGGEGRFDKKGYALRTVNNREIRVGPVGLDPAASFQALQGARTVFVMGDFERDGLNDLVVGDTFGVVRYYRNVGAKGEPLFAAPIVVGDLKSRLLVEAADWDADGRLDVIAGSSGGQVKIFRNVGNDGGARFAPGFSPPLPKIIQPRVMVADLNGDGDQDLFFPSTQGSCLVERSFVDHGYAKGQAFGGIQSSVDRQPGSSSDSRHGRPTGL